MLCKIGTLSATHGVPYATPFGVATPSLGSPALQHHANFQVTKLKGKKLRHRHNIDICECAVNVYSITF